jgi:hypothetical protein
MDCGKSDREAIHRVCQPKIRSEHVFPGVGLDPLASQDIDSSAPEPMNRKVRRHRRFFRRI